MEFLKEGIADYLYKDMPEEEILVRI